jgi:hypothetical protein
MTLTRADILPNAAFLAGRRRFEADVLAAKAVRRLAVGSNVTLLFENRQTCWWQVQEMCRVEQITDPVAIDHEVATYSALLPRPDSLSLTMLIEYDEPAVRAEMLTRLLGLHRSTWLKLEGLSLIAARFDDAQFNDVRVSAVQFVRIPLPEGAATALGDFSRAASFVIDHPVYSATVPLPRTLRAALLDDITP